MNPNLNALHPYPFQKLRDLFAGITPNPAFKPINLSIGEPKHATPEFIKQALTDHLGGLSNYPTTLGSTELRQAISNWLVRRYAIPALDIEKQIIPVNGSREALFSFAQAVIDTSHANPVVLSPNPFYQIYEGAALLAGAEPYYLNTLPDNDFNIDYSSVPESVWKRVQLLYVCSPGNPTGKVMGIDDWREVYALADKYGFVVASDECYSEIYFNENQTPLGSLQAAHQLGRGFERVVMFSSLSKRSNVPGMRSGFVAGDAKILEKFLLYRTYHGCAMNPAVQAASAAAWNDETHVVENRRLYAEKFQAITPLLQKVMQVEMPDAAFYLWGRVRGSDTTFASELYKQANVTVLPGSYLAREAHGINPGEGFVRLALVASLAECLDAAESINKIF
ncbi:MAG: succinyldiaminopimelate transaminase [Methylophilales bacterium]|nr:succinyldiaminopimelate transaminase [Methylophilales bacterium]